MKELQDLRNDILLLKNYGSISKEVELVLLRKLNTIEKQLMLGNVVGQSEQLKPNGSYYTECECGNLVHAREKNCKKCGL